ncbi:MAG: hypothetical protein KC496_21905, partial [Anaerolineae bacterium]|nr:hypothetical protein [Anaerolineae bacterium]
MQGWLYPPIVEDEYQSFSLRVLHYTLLLLLTILIIAVPFIQSPLGIVFTLASSLVIVSCYALLHWGFIRIGSVLFLFGLWLILTIAAFSLNGIRNAGVSSYAIVILYTAILFPGRAVIVTTLVSLASLLMLLIGELQGL